MRKSCQAADRLTDKSVREYPKGLGWHQDEDVDTALETGAGWSLGEWISKDRKDPGPGNCPTSRERAYNDCQRRRRGVRAWTGMLAAAALGVDPPAYEPIHPPTRVFTPAEVRARLKAEPPAWLGSMVESIARDPKRLASLAKLAERVQQKLPPDSPLLDPDRVDPSIRALAEKLAADPGVREAFLDSPELRENVERLADRVPENLRDRWAQSIGSQPPLPGAAGRSDSRSAGRSDSASSRSTGQASERNNQGRRADEGEEGAGPVERADRKAIGPGRRRNGLQPTDDLSPDASENANGADHGAAAGRSGHAGDGRPDADALGASGERSGDGAIASRIRRARGPGGQAGDDGRALAGDQGREGAEGGESAGGSATSQRFTQAIEGLQRLGGPLSRSPTLERTIARLKENEAPGTASASTRWTPPESIGRWTRDFNNFAAGTMGGSATASRLGGFFGRFAPPSGLLSRLPKLPRLPAISTPKFSFGSFNFRPPSFVAPKLDASAAATAGRQALVPIIAGAAVMCLVAWGLRSIRWPAPWHRSSPRRGPPTDTSVRSQVVWLFEDVALERLGEVARPRHHRRITRELASQAPVSAAEASELGTLYERARYSPTEEPLSTDDLARALDLARRLGGRPLPA